MRLMNNPLVLTRRLSKFPRKHWVAKVIAIILLYSHDIVVPVDFNIRSFQSFCMTRSFFSSAWNGRTEVFAGWRGLNLGLRINTVLMSASRIEGIPADC